MPSISARVGDTRRNKSTLLTLPPVNWFPVFIEIPQQALIPMIGLYCDQNGGNARTIYNTMYGTFCITSNVNVNTQGHCTITTRKCRIISSVRHKTVAHSVFHGDFTDCNRVCKITGGGTGVKRSKYDSWRRNGFTEQWGGMNIRRRLSESIQGPWPRPSTMVVTELRERGKHEVWCLSLIIIKYITIWTYQTTSVWLTWCILLSGMGAWCAHFLPGNLFTWIYVCNGKCLIFWCDKCVGNSLLRYSIFNLHRIVDRLKLCQLLVWIWWPVYHITPPARDNYDWLLTIVTMWRRDCENIQTVLWILPTKSSTNEHI